MYKVYLINKKRNKDLKILLKKYFYELKNKKISISIKKLISKKNSYKYFIKYNNLTIGFIILSFNKNIYNEKICYINDLFVDKKFRRLKIATKVIKDIIKESKKKKIKEIRIEILKNNKKAILFWKKFHFHEKSVNFNLKI